MILLGIEYCRTYVNCGELLLRRIFYCAELIKFYCGELVNFIAVQIVTLSIIQFRKSNHSEETVYKSIDKSLCSVIWVEWRISLKAIKVPLFTLLETILRRQINEPNRMGRFLPVVCSISPLMCFFPFPSVKDD